MRGRNLAAWRSQAPPSSALVSDALLMPVDLLPLAEMEQRLRMLTEQAASMCRGRKREHVLTEIELLRSLADLKQFFETFHKYSSRDVPCSPPTRYP